MPTRSDGAIGNAYSEQELTVVTADRISETQIDTALDLATETLYRFVAALLGGPRTPGWGVVRDLVSQQLALDAASLLREEHSAGAAPLGYGELPIDELDLTAVVQELRAPGADFESEHARVFGLVSCRECPPYESEFHPNEDTFFRSQQMADVAGFYRAFGVRPGSDSRERPDHLPLELEFAAILLCKQRLAAARAEGPAPEASQEAQLCLDARRAFIQDHLIWWLPSFSLAMRHKAEQGLYEAAGRVLAALLALERNRLGISPPGLPLLEPRSAEQESDCSGCIGLTS